MYALANCNNFFASCERVFRPELNGKPVIVLSNNDGCVVAKMAVVALVLVIAFLPDELGHPGKRVFLLLLRQLPEQDGVPSVHDHGQRFVDFLHHFWAVAASQCRDSSRWMVTFRKPAAVRCVFSSSGV